jgi:hypothetical protein
MHCVQIIVSGRRKYFYFYDVVSGAVSLVDGIQGINALPMVATALSIALRRRGDETTCVGLL